MLPCLVHQLLGERFDIVRAAPRVDFLTNLGLFLNVNLCITSNTSREVGRQGDCLVECVGVKRLSMSECGTHSLDTSTTDIVERVLLRERPTGGLAVGTQRHRLGVLGTERFDNLCPQHTTCTHLGNLHEVVHTDSPEEGQTWCKGIDIHTRIDTGTQVFHTVGKCISQLDVCCSTRLLHVVAGDGDGVELRHLL